MTRERRLLVQFCEVGGHWELAKQLNGRRFHYSWSSRDKVKLDIGAFMRLKELGFDLQVLVRQIEGSKGRPAIARLGPKGPISFEKFVTTIFLPLREGHVKPSGFSREKYRARQLLRLLPNKMIHEFDAEELERRRQAYQATVGSKKTINNMLHVMKAIFKMAKALEYLRENPMTAVKMVRASGTRNRPLTQGQMLRLWSVATPRVRQWIVLALYTGMREGEIAELRDELIDFETREVVLPDSKNSKGRRIYIHDAAWRVIQELPRSVSSPYVLRGPRRQDCGVFPKNSWVAAVKKAGMKDFRFHDLRHTFATWLREAKVENVTIAELLGHHVPSMTPGYAHLTRGERKRVIEVLPDLFGPDGAPSKETGETESV